MYNVSCDLQCVPEMRSGYFESRQQLLIADLPLMGYCSFRVPVLLDGNDYKWSNNRTCSRKLVPGNCCIYTCNKYNVSIFFHAGAKWLSECIV